MRGSFSARGLDQHVECEVEIVPKTSEKVGADGEVTVSIIGQTVTLLFDSTDDHAVAASALDDVGFLVDFYLDLEDGRGFTSHRVFPKLRARLTKMAWELRGVHL